MSELINTKNTERGFRKHLLVTVSALALLASVSIRDAKAAADDADRPTVWIELGGQLDSLSNGQAALSPPFVASITQANLSSALNVQEPPAQAVGLQGRVSFQPDDSNWVFSASVQFGRSQTNRHRHQQTANELVPKYAFTVFGFHAGGFSYYPNGHVKLADGTEKENESHIVLDFQAGKDVGLGMFGGRGSSTVSTGVRFAQFSSRDSIGLHAEPDVQYPTAPIASIGEIGAFQSAHMRFHDYAATADSTRSFTGLGPEISWNASAPFMGEKQDGELTLDWGLNAAVLFGRQKARGHHTTTVKSYYVTHATAGANVNGVKHVHFVGPCEQHRTFDGEPLYYTAEVCAHHTSTTPHNRSRGIVVPNLGGFAGLSFRYSNAKVSLGYRGDFFFGAMDGGIDAAKKENVGFYGPFASVSVGLGG